MNGTSDHVSAPVPPVAANDCEYVTPTLPNGSGDVVVMKSGVTLSVNCRAAKFAPFETSAALMRNVYVPEMVGVPLNVPLVDSVTPVGSAPPITVHVIPQELLHPAERDRE